MAGRVIVLTLLKRLQVSADGGITLVRGLGSIIQTMEASGRAPGGTARSLMQHKSTLHGAPSNVSAVAKGTLPHGLATQRVRS